MKKLVGPRGEVFLYNGNDIHTHNGVITATDIESNTYQVATNKGVLYSIMDANNHDIRSTIKRGPQIILEKDIGYILARSGITKDANVLEAGTGSGAATLVLADFCHHVYSYEKHPKHHDIARKNLKKLEKSNVTLVEGDISEAVLEGLPPLHLVLLDMPTPLEAIPHITPYISPGSYIVCYLPSISQVDLIDKFCKEHDQYHLDEVTELLHRTWKISEYIQRPDHNMLGHTAFLCFVRVNS